MRNPSNNLLLLGKRLGEFGTEAVPAVLETFRAEHGPVVLRGALYAAGEIGPLAPELLSPIAKFLNSGDRDVRLNAIVAVGKFGPLAKNSVPEATALLYDSDGGIKTAARQALVRIGLPALPELEKGKRWRLFGDLSTWKGALDDLRLMRPGFTIADANRHYGRMYPNARASDLLIKFSTSTGFDKDFALMELARIGPETMDVLPQLTDILRNDPSPGYRFLSVQAIGSQGEKAVSAILQVVEALSDCDADVRLASGWALGSIGPKAVPFVKESLKSRDVREQFAAVRALEFIYSAEAWNCLKEYWRQRSDGFSPYEEDDLRRIIGAPH